MRASFLLVCLSILLVGIFFVRLSYAKIDPKTCIGMWLFDDGKGDTAQDSSGNKNHGTIKGAPKCVNGKFDKALQFDGIDDYIELPEIREQTDQPLSFVAWINWEGNKAVTRGIWGYTNTGTVNCHFEIQSGGMRIRLGNINKTGMTFPPVNEWVLVCYTYDGNTAKYYLKGTEVDNFTGKTGTILGGRDTLGHMIGTSDSGRFFDGIIDEAALFNVALTESDIKDIMNQGIGKATGLVSVNPKDRLATYWGEIKIK